MRGQVYKIHSDFYYVCANGEILECKLREVLKKQKIEVLTGDFVEVENSYITKVLERKNKISRPSVANLDTLVIVSAIKEPKLDFIQLNRYLIFAKIHKIPAILCFNKEDLSDDCTLKDGIEKIYKALKYKIVFTSAIKKTGLCDFKKLIKGKTIALAGQSGVGKTSLINALADLSLKTRDVSQKTQRGTHTTRHVEILEFDDFKIMDTPGFSCLKFDFILPNVLCELFDEIKKYGKNCKFKDCTHEDGSIGCAVLKNINKINISRYQSYLEFLREAKEYEEKISKRSIKNEAHHKIVANKTRVKLSARKREGARNTRKQRIKNEEL